MTAQRKGAALASQHKEVSALLLAARVLVHRTFSVIGLEGGRPGSVKAKEADSLLRLERALDKTRTVLDERLHRDRPDEAAFVYWPQRSQVDCGSGAVHAATALIELAKTTADAAQRRGDVAGHDAWLVALEAAELCQSRTSYAYVNQTHGDP